MTRITVDVDDALLEAAREVLGTTTKVATINAALRASARQRHAADLVAAFEEFPLEMESAHPVWRHGGARDLTGLEERAARA